MDRGSCSDAKMSGRDSNAMTRLSRSVEIAELSPSRLDDFASLAYRNGDRTPAQIAKEGFPKFKHLPPELRSKIWQDSMPPYGVYTALMLGREEPMPQQPPAPAPMVFRVVYRLEPVHRDQQDYEMMMRLDSMRAIQRVNSEAASEVERAFPTTINCTNGKLRFNAKWDTLSLSDLKCHLGRGFTQRFKRYTEGAVIFSDDWHKIPRTMLFNNVTVWCSFSVLHPRARAPSNSGFEGFEGFMKFLADCTSLRTFGFMYNRRGLYTENFDLKEHRPRVPDPDYPYEVRRFNHLGPEMRSSFYDCSWDSSIHSRLLSFVWGFKGLQAFVGGLPPGQQVPGRFRSLTFGRQELQHLSIKAMIPTSLELYKLLKSVHESIDLEC